MERIKVRQQKFKRGKEKMLSIAQESGDGQTLIQPEDDDDDDGMREISSGQVEDGVAWLVVLQEPGSVFEWTSFSISCAIVLCV